ncbi:helix-turn-helix domain-containing protein [Chitinophaga vietnamensis]|uniref:helix-turn-helix domain-containing protein n=1 Tax=Chitinophaga vietnamensis TaxID=2593957 RepID=UPI001178407C|nr:helix-turn-helix domain-containing protein [Chitinophaga vietnamensis]
MRSFKMQHEEFAPPEALQDAIRCFWYNREDFGAASVSFEVVPDGYAEIIFYFGEMTRGAALQPLPSPFIMGLLNQPVVFHATGLLEIIGVRCYPWTVFDLLGLPATKDGLQIFEHPVSRLQSVLNTYMREGKIAAALAQVKAYFLDARMHIAADTMLFKAGAAMRKANGAMPVSQVAAAAHTTVRTLERKFKQSSGHTVKDVSGLIRFEQVRNQLWHHPDTNIAGLAQELGYADQAHLSKEFKRYSGTTPAAFARNAKKSKRDFVAFVQE